MFDLDKFTPGDPSVPFQGEQADYLKMLLSQIGEEFVNVHEYGSAQNIVLVVPAGRAGNAEDMLGDLQQYLEPDAGGGAAQLPSGLVAWFDGTWAAARNLNGWAVCDGTNGTRDMISDERFLRSVGSGCDAGATGGSETHGHGVSLTSCDICDTGAGLGVVTNVGVSAGSSIAPNLALIPIMKL